MAATYLGHAAACPGLLHALSFAAESRPAMNDDPFERKAIAGAREGDSGAYDYLVAKYAKKVLAIATGLLRNREDAEDVAQEAFVKAYRFLGRFRQEQPFGPWIYRIVTNLALDQLRHRKRHDPAEVVAEDVITAEQADAPMESRELAQAIDRAIESLPEMQRVVARLVLVEEFDAAEAASMLNVREGTVRSHLSLARGKLKEALNVYRRS